MLSLGQLGSCLEHSSYPGPIQDAHESFKAPNSLRPKYLRGSGDVAEQICCASKFYRLGAAMEKNHLCPGAGAPQTVAGCAEVSLPHPVHQSHGITSQYTTSVITREVRKEMDKTSQRTQTRKTYLYVLLLTSGSSSNQNYSSPSSRLQQQSCDFKNNNTKLFSALLNNYKKKTKTVAFSP